MQSGTRGPSHPEGQHPTPPPTAPSMLRCPGEGCAPRTLPPPSACPRPGHPPLLCTRVTHHLTLTRPSPLSPRVQQPGTIHIPRDTGQSRKPVLLVTTGESLLPPHGQGPGALLIALRWPLGKGRATRGSPAPRLPPTSPRSRTPVSRREGRQLRLASLRLRRVVQNPLHLLLDFAGLQQPAVVVQPDLEVAAPVEYDDVLAVPDVLDGVWGRARRRTTSTG